MQLYITKNLIREYVIRTLLLKIALPRAIKFMIMRMEDAENDSRANDYACFLLIRLFLFEIKPAAPQCLFGLLVSQEFCYH